MLATLDTVTSLVVLLILVTVVLSGNCSPLLTSIPMQIPSVEGTTITLLPSVTVQPSKERSQLRIAATESSLAYSIALFLISLTVGSSASITVATSIVFELPPNLRSCSYASTTLRRSLISSVSSVFQDV